MAFDLENPILVKYADAESLIRTGDVALFRGSTFISREIQRFTGGPHNHAGLLSQDCETCKIDLLEIREFYGGRRTPLLGHVCAAPGKIDVFQIDRKFAADFDPNEAAELMRDLTSRKYGYFGVAEIYLRRLPFIWRLFSTSISDVAEGRARPFCSHAVSAALRAGGVDPVRNCPDHLVTPADLFRSLALRYRFTLVPS